MTKSLVFLPPLTWSGSGRSATSRHCGVLSRYRRLVIAFCRSSQLTSRDDASSSHIWDTDHDPVVVSVTASRRVPDRRNRPPTSFRWAPVRTGRRLSHRVTQRDIVPLGWLSDPSPRIGRLLPRGCISSGAPHISRVGSTTNLGTTLAYLCASVDRLFSPPAGTRTRRETDAMICAASGDSIERRVGESA